MILRLTLLIALLSSATPAMAQEAPTEDGLRAARDRYLQGKSHYDGGDYSAAIVAWEEAYELSQRHDLLYNLANAYERNGQPRLALERLKAYQPHASADEVENIDQRLAHLKVRVAELDTVAALSDADAARAETERLEAEQALLKRERDLEVERRKLAEAPAKTPAKFSVPGVMLTAAGTASMAAGGFFAIDAKKQADFLEDTCVEVGAKVLCPSGASAGLTRLRTDRALGYTLLITGAVAVGAGIALLITHKPAKPITTVWAAPLPQGAAIGVHLVR